MYSVLHPPSAEVARNIATIVAGLPPLTPGLLGSFPKSVLDNAQVVGSKASLAEVKAEANNVGDSSMHFSDGHFLFANLFMEVKQRQLGDLGVNSGEFTLTLTSNAGLLISVRVLVELDDFAHEDAVRVSGVGS